MRYLTLVLVGLVAWQAAPRTGVSPADAPVAVSLTERNNGGTVLLAEDGTAKLKLFLNPAGGTLWLLEDASSRAVQLTAKPTTAGLKTKKPYQTFSFKGLEPGVTTLRLRQANLRGSAGSNDPVFVVNVHVIP